MIVLGADAYAAVTEPGTPGTAEALALKPAHCQRPPPGEDSLMTWNVRISLTTRSRGLEQVIRLGQGQATGHSLSIGELRGGGCGRRGQGDGEGE
jgi:hypothetical protein